MRNPTTMILVAVVLSITVTADIKYRVRRMPLVPGGQQFTFAMDINDSGIICGYRSTAVYQRYRAVTWNPSTGDVIEYYGECSPNSSTTASFINNAGHVIGSRSTTCESDYWLWRPEEGYLPLVTPPGGWTEWLAFNSLDTLVGRSATSYLTWSPESGIAALNHSPFDINDNGWMLGRSYVWDPEVGLIALRSLPGMDGEFPTAAAINNDNQILGSGRFEGQFLPFVWSPTGRTEWLPVPFNQSSAGGGATSFSDNLIVLGTAGYYSEEDAMFIEFPCLWRPGRPPQILGSDSFDPCETDWNVLDTFDSPHPPVRGPNIRGQFVMTMYYPPNPERWAGAVLTPYIPGDLDPIAGSANVGDGDVDLQDLAYMLGNFGRTEGADYAAGDLDCDQDVDLEDLSVLLANFGETLP